MKIGMVGPVTPYRGGIAHFTTLLAKKLIEAGHEVQVISFKKQYPAWLYPGESDKDYSPGRERVDAEYLLTPLNPLSWHRAVKALADFQPQQVIIPWWVTIWGPAFRFLITRLKRRGIPAAMLIHNTLPHEARAFDRWLARRALEKADRYIVMTEKEKGRLVGLLPEATAIRIVPHPIYHMFPSKTIEQNIVRKRLGVPEDKPILLFFGFIRSYKGLDILLEALKLLNDEKREVHLLVAGEFWDNRKTYDNLINRLNLGSFVHIFSQYIPDDEVWQFFNAADVFVAPYTGGTQSGALKAAIGFGLPAVVTDVITDDIVLMFPKMCFVSPANNAELLAESIRHALNAPKLDISEISPYFNQSWDYLIETTSNFA